MTKEQEILCLKAQVGMLTRRVERLTTLNAEIVNNTLKLNGYVELPQEVIPYYSKVVNEVKLHAPLGKNGETISEVITKYVDDYLVEYGQRRY